MNNPKPQIGPAGITANIAYYESRVQEAYDNWQQELAQVEYWLEELEKCQEHSQS